MILDEQAVSRLVAEMDSARAKWGAYRSTHEVYGVLSEEMEELLDAIHADDDRAARAEALQIAAVALRFAVEGWKRDQ
ncbi:MAG: hypothetical protein ACHQ1G_00150 [Planctomycetota bacterium]